MIPLSVFIQCALRDSAGYPLHRHEAYEIIQFIQGTGTLFTPDARYSYGPGSIFIIPPGVLHGSESHSPTRRFWLQGEFRSLFHFSQPVCLCDNSEGEGAALFRMILRNRLGDREYLDALCAAYGRFVLHDLRLEDQMARAVDSVVQQISEKLMDPEFSPTQALRDTGYAEDYIRACFHQRTGRTPGQFLTELRIGQARELMELYGDALSLAQVAEQCGYTDYAYFSRKFRQITGTSPRTWRSKR